VIVGRADGGQGLADPAHLRQGAGVRGVQHRALMRASRAAGSRRGVDAAPSTRSAAGAPFPDARPPRSGTLPQIERAFEHR
jgi:hypothetical protein